MRTERLVSQTQVVRGSFLGGFGRIVRPCPCGAEARPRPDGRGRPLSVRSIPARVVRVSRAHDLGPLPFSSGGGCGAEDARQVLARVARLDLADLLKSAGRDDLSAGVAPLGAEVDHLVGGFDVGANLRTL